MKILLVEDDQPTAEFLSTALSAQHYTIDVVTDGQMALDIATAWDYDLILLDILIPKLDGISLCRQLRAQRYQKPIILITIKNSSADVVRGLDAGADDYITKPYNLQELLARVRALLRRGETLITPTLLNWEHLCVNSVAAQVTYRGQTLSLTPKEYSLLVFFLRNPQRVFSRSEIIDRLWSIDASPSDRAVTNLIKDLRQKLKAAGMTTEIIDTVYGLGYRLKPEPVNQESKAVSSELKTGEIKGQGKSQESQQELALVNKMLEQFKDTFAQRVTVLEEVEQALQAKNLEPRLRLRGEQEAHRLAGALGSFGYATSSKLALAIEHLLIGDKHLEPTQIFQFSKLLTDLKQELTKPPKLLTTREIDPIDGPRVLVIDTEVSFTAQLRTDAVAWGLRIEIASDLNIARQKLNQSPDAILLNLIWQDAVEPGLAMLQELREKLPTVPVLIMTKQDNLQERVLVSRLGGKRFLRKPIATAQVLEEICQILPKPPKTEAKVMVVDDDPVMLKALKDLLQPWGLQVRSLQDPRQFWEMLTATKPDLLLLDLEMPTFGGIDLCRVVRQDPQWENLPILVVTAHTDVESIQQVFAVGADDFIGKPIVGPELVTRVISRIDRSRLQQQLEEMQQRSDA